MGSIDALLKWRARGYEKKLGGTLSEVGKKIYPDTSVKMGKEKVGSYGIRKSRGRRLGTG